MGSIALVLLTGCSFEQSTDSKNSTNKDTYILPNTSIPAPAPSFSDTEQKNNF